MAMNATMAEEVALVSASPAPSGLMEVMGPDGDLKSTWDKDNPDEVAAARSQFDRLTKKGYIAYRVKGKGDRGEVIREFDPEAGSLILSPAMAGG
jgi:hypothetical protein